MTSIKLVKQWLHEQFHLNVENKCELITVKWMQITAIACVIAVAAEYCRTNNSIDKSTVNRKRRHFDATNQYTFNIQYRIWKLTISFALFMWMDWCFNDWIFVCMWFYVPWQLNILWHSKWDINSNYRFTWLCSSQIAHTTNKLNQIQRLQ